VSDNYVFSLVLAGVAIVARVSYVPFISDFEMLPFLVMLGAYLLLAQHTFSEKEKK
jgi:hypothetical protein